MRLLSLPLTFALSVAVALPVLADPPSSSCPLTGAREAAAASRAIGNDAAAIDALNCALNANFHDADARADRLVIALGAGRYGLAASDASTLRNNDRARFDTLVTTTEALSSSNPYDLDTLKLLGLLHWADARDDLALNDYQAILASQPSDVFAFLFRGSSRLYMGDDIHASADFQQAVNLDTNNPDVYSIIGSTYQQIGNIFDALMALDRAIALNPQDARSHYYRGMVLFSNRDVQGAQSEFTLALSCDPAYVDAYYDRARASYQLANSNAAISDLDQALAINPEFDLALVFRGALHEWAGETSSATSDLYAYTVAMDASHLNGGALSPNVPATVSLDTRIVYRFTFEASAGETVQLTATSAQQQADPVLVLLGPDGQTPLSASDDVTPNVHDAVITNVVLPQTGTYTVLVTHSDSNVRGPVIVTLSVR
ncbi:MAG TPA: tetratricopeptide repeat protein [Candidatus Limnocylindrales bacterium]|nr:tetratricopeptide repeat protein [Candidatus Limnocylindrales bacterium]